MRKKKGLKACDRFLFFSFCFWDSTINFIDGTTVRPILIHQRLHTCTFAYESRKGLQSRFKCYLVDFFFEKISKYIQMSSLTNGIRLASCKPAFYVVYKMSINSVSFVCLFSFRLVVNDIGDGPRTLIFVKCQNKFAF